MTVYPIDILASIVFIGAMEKSINDDELILNPPPKKYRVSDNVKVLFAVVFLLGIAFYFYIIVERRLSQNNYLLQNQMAAVKLVASSMPPIFMVDPLSNKEINFSDFKGRWVLLNLWATWCPPCQQEMPSLEVLEKNLGSKLTIIALSADDTMDPVINFIHTHKPSFKVLFDREKQVTKLLGVDKYPETFLISPEGEFVAQLSGPRDWSSPAALSYFNGIIK